VRSSLGLHWTLYVRPLGVTARVFTDAGREPQHVYVTAWLIRHSTAAASTHADAVAITARIQRWASAGDDDDHDDDSFGRPDNDDRYVARRRAASCVAAPRLQPLTAPRPLRRVPCALRPTLSARFVSSGWTNPGMMRWSLRTRKATATRHYIQLVVNARITLARRRKMRKRYTIIARFIHRCLKTLICK